LWNDIEKAESVELMIHEVRTGGPISVVGIHASSTKYLKHYRLNPRNDAQALTGKTAGNSPGIQIVFTISDANLIHYPVCVLLGENDKWTDEFCTTPVKHEKMGTSIVVE
jgi:hypothetical protein